MRPRLTVFKNKDVSITFWHSKPLEKSQKYRFLILCYGLPSHPYQHNPAKLEAFTDRGFVLVYPNYIGTWASSGVMSWESCIDTIKLTVDLIGNKEGSSVYDEKSHFWDVEDISIIGGSFGASVALVAGAKITKIKKIVAVAGPTDWRTHSRIPEEASEPIEDLYYSICRGWGNLWRIPSKVEWDRLAQGTADINPIDYVEELKKKDVLLIHGKNDSVVSPERSEDLHENLGKRSELLLLDEGHLGNDIVGYPEVYPKVLSFLDKHTS